MSDFVKELESLINRHSIENGSNTPDFVLADYLQRCLLTFNYTVNSRESWYGRKSAEINERDAGGSPQDRRTALLDNASLKIRRVSAGVPPSDNTSQAKICPQCGGELEEILKGYRCTKCNVYYDYKAVKLQP